MFIFFFFFVYFKVTEEDSQKISYNLDRDEQAM